MKIYLDNGLAHRYAGGIAVYSDRLYAGLTERGLDVTRPRHPLIGRIRWPSVRRLCYSLLLNFFLPAYLRINKYDIAHFTNFQVPFFGNHLTKYISTVHDVNPLLFPETTPSAYLRYFRLVMKNIARKADVVVTVSSSVKTELLEIRNFRFRTIKVCPIGSNIKFDSHNVRREVPAKYALESGSYFLCVGRLEKRKNLIRLIDAFDEYKEHTETANKLVLVGSDGFGARDVRHRVSLSMNREDILVTGHVSARELQAFYANARAFIFPSIYEGFGIPLLEAMQFNLPIILSDIPTNRELVNSRGYFYDKEKVGELRDLMKKTAEDGCASVDYSDILDRYSVERMIDTHIEAYLGRSGGHENPPLAPRKGGNGMKN